MKYGNPPIQPPNIGGFIAGHKRHRQYLSEKLEPDKTTARLPVVFLIICNIPPNFPY
jgi:hypothetical protein